METALVVMNDAELRSFCEGLGLVNIPETFYCDGIDIDKQIAPYKPIESYSVAFSREIEGPDWIFPFVITKEDTEVYLHFRDYALYALLEQQVLNIGEYEVRDDYNQFCFFLGNTSEDLPNDVYPFFNLELSEKFVTESEEIQLSFKPLSKNMEEQMVYGYAYVSEIDGERVVDLHNDTIPLDVLKKSAHKFMLESRVGLEMHTGDQVGQIVESLVITEDIVKRFNMQNAPLGWYIGYKVLDEAVWERVKSGDFTGFSIGGLATFVERQVDEEA